MAHVLDELPMNIGYFPCFPGLLARDQRVTATLLKHHTVVLRQIEVVSIPIHGHSFRGEIRAGWQRLLMWCLRDLLCVHSDQDLTFDLMVSTCFNMFQPCWKEIIFKPQKPPVESTGHAASDWSIGHVTWKCQSAQLELKRANGFRIHGASIHLQFMLW